MRGGRLVEPSGAQGSTSRGRKPTHASDQARRTEQTLEAAAVATTIRFEDSVEIPLNIRSLGDFRRWATSDTFPEQDRIDYVSGSIEVDMSPEDLHTHGKLKTELVAVLWQRIKQNQLGELYTDRARACGPPGDVPSEPDLAL